MIEIPIVVFIVMLVLCLACCFIPVAQIVDRRNALRLARKERDEARKRICEKLASDNYHDEAYGGSTTVQGAAKELGWSYLYDTTSKEK